MNNDPWTTHAPDSPPPPSSGDNPSRTPFWRLGPRERHTPEPRPPVWELPEPPSLLTHLKQQLDRWLPGWRRREDTVRLAPPSGADGVPPVASEHADPSERAQAQPPDASASISIAVLENAYEAVRQGRVTDPDTIRQIAQRFSLIEPDADTGEDMSFDPQEAGRALRQRAEQITLERGLDTEPDSGPGARGGQSNAPRAPHPPQQIARDDNVTRGG